MLDRARRLAGVVLAAGYVAVLAGCGSGEEAAKAPPGSPDNPLINNPDNARVSGRSAKDESASKPSAPGFNAILEQQRKARASSQTSTDEQTNPCTFVTRAQAEAILGARLLDPFVAPQGPTCVYRNRSGSAFATVAVESMDGQDVRRSLGRTERVRIAGRLAYCGVRGRPMLYLPLPNRRVLSVAAPCDTAVRFARRAARRLIG